MKHIKKILSTALAISVVSSGYCSCKADWFVRLGDYGTISHVAEAYHNEYKMELWKLCDVLLKYNGLNEESARYLSDDYRVRMPDTPAMIEEQKRKQREAAEKARREREAAEKAEKERKQRAEVLKSTISKSSEAVYWYNVLLRDHGYKAYDTELAYYFYVCFKENMWGLQDRGEAEKLRGTFNLGAYRPTDRVNDHITWARDRKREKVEAEKKKAAEEAEKKRKAAEDAAIRKELEELKAKNTQLSAKCTEQAKAIEAAKKELEASKTRQAEAERVQKAAAEQELKVKMEADKKLEAANAQVQVAQAKLAESEERERALKAECEVVAKNNALLSAKLSGNKAEQTKQEQALRDAQAKAKEAQDRADEAETEAKLEKARADEAELQVEILKRRLEFANALIANQAEQLQKAQDALDKANEELRKANEKTARLEGQLDRTELYGRYTGRKSRVVK